MARPDDSLTLGVEEEFQLVDPDSRAVIRDAGEVLQQLPDQRADHYDREIERPVVETRTDVCASLGDVRLQLQALRAELAKAAERAGCRLAAGATLPILTPGVPEVTPTQRYQEIADHVGHIVRSQLVTGCHVHIGVPDRDEAVGVLNRARAWLPTLLALSANSPYWQQTDTGYGSYRTMLWIQWPSAQIPATFASAAEYDQLVQALIAAGIVVDARQVYWDLRLSEEHATLEFRIADVTPTVDETLLQAGLARALTRTCLAEARRGATLVPVRPELLRGAKWRAARFGLTGQLVHPVTGGTVAACELVDQLLDYVRPALEEEGDWREVSELVERTKRDGTGAQRQRRAFARDERFADVVDLVVRETLR